MTPQFHGGRGGSSRGRSHKPASAAASSKSSEAIRPLDPTLTPPDITTFRHWELGEEIQGAIEGMGITVPSPIQRLAIGPVLAGKDVIAKAETGTGKTLAFGAPMMSKIDPQRASVLGLVMCPTRELAEQVQKVLSDLGKPRGIEVALIVGGEPMEPQIKALKRGAQVVVGTPGRILDLYKQRFLSFPWTEFAILDEADVMFEFGFIDDVKEILSYTPEERQTLLFSATFPVELLKLARENTRDPAEVATAAGVKTVDNIEQSVIFLDDEDRTLALMRLIENSDPEDTFLVFCPRRTDVDKLIRRLERMPFSIKALHGGYDQAARFRVMAAFRTGEVKALIATDVASRGLDVKHVSTVVNYGSPHDITDYTHRIGRTGRAGRKGRAITLVGGVDRRKWSQIERDATWKIPEVDPPLRGERPRPRRDEVPVGPGCAGRGVTRAARRSRPLRPSGAGGNVRGARNGPRRARRIGREERSARRTTRAIPCARRRALDRRPRRAAPRGGRPERVAARRALARARGCARGPRSRAPDRAAPGRSHRPPRPPAAPARGTAALAGRRRRTAARSRAARGSSAPRCAARRRAANGAQRGETVREEAPRGEFARSDAHARAQRDQTQRGQTPREAAPRGPIQGGAAPRGRAPRDAEGRAPAESRPHGRDARSERPARPDAGAARASSRPVEPARAPFFAPDEPAPEHDMRPRGPDSAPRRAAPRAEPGRTAPVRRDAEVSARSRGAGTTRLRGARAAHTPPARIAPSLIRGERRREPRAARARHRARSVLRALHPPRASKRRRACRSSRRVRSLRVRLRAGASIRRRWTRARCVRSNPVAVKRDRTARAEAERWAGRTPS